MREFLSCASVFVSDTTFTIFFHHSSRVYVVVTNRNIYMSDLFMRKKSISPVCYSCFLSFKKVVGFFKHHPSFVFSPFSGVVAVRTTAMTNFVLLFLLRYLKLCLLPSPWHVILVSKKERKNKKRRTR